jgi:hypothetical protein
MFVQSSPGVKWPYCLDYFMASYWHWRYHFIFNLFEVLFNYIILFYIYTWILVLKSTQLMCLDVEKSRILTMRGMTKTRMKGEGIGSFRPWQQVDSLLYNNRWSLFRQFFGNYLFISCIQKKITTDRCHVNKFCN